MRSKAIEGLEGFLYQPAISEVDVEDEGLNRAEKLEDNSQGIGLDCL